MSKNNRLDQKKFLSALKRAVLHYSEYKHSSFLIEELAKNLMQRLEWMKIAPDLIVDIGSKTKESTLQLIQHFPKACVVSLECDHSFFQVTNEKGNGVVSNYHQLPFQDQSVDLVFSSLTLHWTNDIVQTFQEWLRILKPGGLLLFSTVGPDTLNELRQSFAASEGHLQITTSHVHSFLDMHDLGDALLQVGFQAPVMDRELLEIHYADVKSMLMDLKNLGAQNALIDRSRGLMGKQRWKNMLKAYKNFSMVETNYDEGPNSNNCAYKATVEVIYGLGWVGSKEKVTKVSNPEEVLVPIDRIHKA